MSDWDVKETGDRIRDDSCRKKLGMMISRIDHKEEIRKEPMGKKACALSRERAGRDNQDLKSPLHP